MEVAGYPAFRSIYDALAGMGFYNFHPEQIRELQSPDPGDFLKPDGGNIASVLENLKSGSPETAERVTEYLSKVVPGTVGMEPKTVGPKLTLEFRQEVRGDRRPWRFLANNVSDGTLRVLGMLVALYQGAGMESVNAITLSVIRQGVACNGFGVAVNHPSVETRPTRMATGICPASGFTRSRETATGSGR